MSTATIAVPASRVEPPDFDRGRRFLDEIEDVALFTFDDPSDAENEIAALLPDLDPGISILDENGEPLLDLVRRAGVALINGLEEALTSREVTSITIAGYEVYVSGGLSNGGSPTDAADQIWNAYKLPESVLLAMGFVPDHTKPLVWTDRSLGSPHRDNHEEAARTGTRVAEDHEFVAHDHAGASRTCGKCSLNVMPAAPPETKHWLWSDPGGRSGAAAPDGTGLPPCPGLPTPPTLSIIPAPAPAPTPRCDANARRSTGAGMCNQPLDAYGQCLRATDHLER
jgi:hypothetical protein